jgi:hypothetical protein
MTLYHYTVALSDKTFDLAAEDNVSALRQIRAMCRVWDDKLVAVWKYAACADGKLAYVELYNRGRKR